MIVERKLIVYGRLVVVVFQVMGIAKLGERGAYNVVVVVVVVA